MSDDVVYLRGAIELERIKSLCIARVCDRVELLEGIIKDMLKCLDAGCKPFDSVNFRSACETAKKATGEKVIFTL